MRDIFIALFVLAYFSSLLLVVIFDCKIYRKDIVMWIKKIGKSVRGDGYSKAEQELIENEVRQQLQVGMGKMELDAMILWILHESCGFGPTRLERFYKDYIPNIAEYLADCREGEEQFEYTKKLEEYGIDITKWYVDLISHGKVQDEELCE